MKNPKIENEMVYKFSWGPQFFNFKYMTVKVDEQGATKVDDIWAGGDVVQLDLVTTAVGHGRPRGAAFRG